MKSWQQRVCVGDTLTQRRLKDDEEERFVTSAPLRLCCFRWGRGQQTSHTDLHQVTFGKEPHIDLLSQMVAFSSIYFTTSLQSRDHRKCAWVHLPVSVSVHVCNFGGNSFNRHHPFCSVCPAAPTTHRHILGKMYTLINDISTNKENDLNTLVPPLTADHKSKSHLPQSDGCGVIYILGKAQHWMTSNSLAPFTF